MDGQADPARVLAAGAGVMAAPLLALAEEQVRSAAHEIGRKASELMALRSGLLSAHASVRWRSPAASSHQELMALDLDRLDMAASRCERAAHLLQGLVDER